MPKVSIVIPVYNVEQYLRECLDSVVNQTLKDIEIICIDDCSTDNSLNILNEYVQKDSRIVVIDKKVNEGLGVTRNIGQKAAKGDYIIFLDSDDYIADDLCEKLINKFESTDADVIYYNSASFIDDRDIKEFNDTHRLKNLPKKFNAAETFFAEQNYNCVVGLSAPVWYKSYKRDFLERNNIFCSDDRCMEDSFFAVNLLLSNPKLAYIDEILHFYRIRPNSLNKNIDDKVDIIFDVYEKCIDCIAKSNLSTKNKLIFVKKYVNWLFYWTRTQVQTKECSKYTQTKRKKYFKQILSLFYMSDLKNAKLPERFWREIYEVKKCGLSIWQDYSSGFLRYKMKFLIFKLSFKVK